MPELLQRTPRCLNSAHLVTVRVCLAVLLLSACSDSHVVVAVLGPDDAGGVALPDAAQDASPPVDAAPPLDSSHDGAEAEAGPSDAAAEGPLALGRCLTEAGQDCTGVPGEGGGFVVLMDDAEIPVVVGPQGASMFVLAARTWGIEPGDPEAPFSADNPVIEIAVTDAAGEDVASYRGRSAFSMGAEDGAFDNSGLFVVIDERASELVGQTLVAEAVLRDRLGNIRTGSLRFVAVAVP